MKNWPSLNLLGSRVNTFVMAFVGGIVGAVLMDITEAAAARIGITSGVNVALVGRWFLGLMRGQLTRADIRASKPPGRRQPGPVTVR